MLSSSVLAWRPEDIRAEGRMEVIRGMLRSGLEPAEIAKWTAVPVHLVQELSLSIHSESQKL